MKNLKINLASTRFSTAPFAPVAPFLKPIWLKKKYFFTTFSVALKCKYRYLVVTHPGNNSVIMR